MRQNDTKITKGSRKGKTKNRPAPGFKPTTSRLAGRDSDRSALLLRASEEPEPGPSPTTLIRPSLRLKNFEPVRAPPSYNKEMAAVGTFRGTGK